MKKSRKYEIAGVRELREILDEQNFKCALTGVVLTPQTASFDHRVPLAKGGNSLKSNLQCVTKTANLAKGSLTMEQFLDLCFCVLNHAGAKSGYRATRKK